MKKYKILILTILLSNLIISSCNDKDGTILEPKSKEENIHWGYFKGTINKKYISIENVGYPEKIGYPFNPIHSNMKGIFYPSGNDKDTIVAMPTSIEYEENASIVIYMYDLKKGIRYLTNSYYKDWDHNRINLYFTKLENETEKSIESRYVTKENNPFKVEILDVIWLNYMKPIIEVKIEGTLYNEKNPTDSITIHATYGTR
ncbi:MAG: DUF5025 domain-containing protein [Bacteroidales bacterium]